MKFTPLRITLIYFFFAILWITTTDAALEWMIDDRGMLTQMQTAKGLFYITLTAVGLYLMIKSYERFISRSKLELQNQKRSLNIALDSARMAVWEYDPETDSYIKSENHNHFFGFDESYSMGLNDVYDRLHPDDLGRFRDKAGETLESGKDFDIKYRVILNGGQVKWLWTKGEPHFDKGKLTTVSGVTIDISESKELELELDFEKERFDLLFDKIPVLVDLFNPELKITKVNKEFEKVLGWTNEDLREMDILELGYPDPIYREMVKKDMSSPGGDWKEYSITAKNGEVRKQLWTNIQLSDNTILGLGYDITERKALENKLRSERESLQKIFDSMPVFINLHDNDAMVGEFNRYFADKFGFSNEEINNGDLIRQITNDDDYEKAREAIRKSDGSWIDFELNTKNGEKLQTTWTNIQISENRSLGIGLDITERIEMEKQLRQNEEWVSLTNKSANIGKWEWNPKTGETKFDEIWANLVGYTLEELKPISIETWNKLVHPDDYPKFEKAVEDYTSGRKNLYECEVRMRHKDGHWVHILDRGKAIEWDENGDPVRLVGTHIDISERIAYEETLEYQASLLANVSDAVLSLNNEFVVVSWNRAAEQIYGWTREEALGKLFHELISTRYESELTDKKAFDMLLSEGYWQGEVLQSTKSGREVQIFSSVTLIRDGDGEISDIIAVNRDITERLQYERENRLLANVFKNSNTALAVSIHSNGKLERVNKAYADLFGYEPEEMIGMDVYEALYPEYEKINAAMRHEWLDNHGFITFECLLRRRDGSEFHSLVNLSLVKEEEHGKTYRIATIQDISDLKRIQDEIANERLRFEVAANTVSDVVWEWNPLDNELWWGDGIESVMGFKKEEYEGDLDFWHNHIFEEDREAVVNSMKRAENSGASDWEYEYRFVAADGSLRRVQDNAALIRDDNGKLLRIIGAMVDVTQMLEYQEALNRERNRFELIARSANDVLYEWNLDTEEVWWSEGWQYRFDYKENDVKPTLDWWIANIHPEDKDDILDSMGKAIEGKESSWSGKYRFKNGNGEYRIVTDKGFFIKNHKGEPVQLIGTISDITADEMAKIELKKSEEQYRLLFEQSPIPMYIYNPDTLDIITVNNAAMNRYGYSEAEFNKMKIYELHPEEELDKVMAEIKKSLKKPSTGFDSWTQVTRNGERLIVEISGSRIFYRDKIQRLIIAKDVTEQRLAEKRLKASEEQYRLLFEQNPVPMWIYDPETYRFSASNKASRERYGYSNKEFMNMTIFDLHKKDEAAEVRKTSEKNRKSKSISFVESNHITKDGKKLIVEISASDIMYKERMQRLVIANDITEQRKAEERAISAILEGEERERHRIAKELHDGLGQYLSAANMNLETVYEDAGEISEPLSKTFKNGLQLLNYAISETRNISQNLLPKAIQDYGLELALEALINQLKGHNNINFYLYQKMDDVEIPDNIQINLYRIAQEAINNAIRHGKPKNINVQNIHSLGEILLTIEDDGRGFDTENVGIGGIGLQSMKTRVGAMAANLDIVSTVGRGTIISVIVPLKTN